MNFPRVKPAGWALNEAMASTLANQLDIDHAASVNGDGGGTYAGALVWNGQATFGEKMVLSGTKAGLCYREPGVMVNIDQALSVEYDYYRADALIAANRTYTLLHTGANVPKVGQRLRASVDGAITSAAFTRSFIREDLTPLGAIDGGGGYGSWIEFQYTVAGWVCCGGGGDDFAMVL